MSGGTQFSNERPKGDAWGIEDAVARAAKEFLTTGRSPMIPCIVVIGVKEVKVQAGEDGPVRVPVVAIKRIDALENDTAIKTAQRLIMRAIEERNHGRGVEMLPFDEQAVITEAFGKVNSAELEQDDRELAEDQALTDPDRLRRHLTAVHGFPADEVSGWETFDVQKTHQSAHDPLSADVMPHDVEWWEWRRIVLAERAAELGHDPGTPWGEAAPEPPAEPVDDEAEMRAHLSAVHDFADELIGGEGLADLRSRHVRDHEEPDPDNPYPAHALADLRAEIAEVDAVEPAAEDDGTVADAQPTAEPDKD